MTTNQLRLPGIAPGSHRDAGAAAAGLTALIVCAAGTGWMAAGHPEWYRLALAIGLATNLIVVAMTWPRAAAIATLLYLPFLALIRRLLIADAGFTSNDPLLLVGPVVALFLVYRIIVIGDRRAHDRLSKLVVWLLVVMVIQVFNPFASGGLITAAGGLLFMAVPLLWFFVGRELADRATVNFLLYGVIIASLVTAIYGLAQTQFGTIASWDQAWLDINGYSSLFVDQNGTGSNIRPFSTFASNQEYALFTGIGVTLVIAFLLRRRFSVVAALPVLALALFLAGGRSALVTSALAVVVLLALLTRNGAAAFLVVALGVGAAYVAAATFGPRLDRAAGLGGNAIVERNVTGILKPLDPSKSTVVGHWDLILAGFAEGIQNPAGHGTGSTTLATRLTGASSQDKENDIANAFVNLGIVGGLLYVAIIVLVFRAVLTRFIRRADVLSFAVVGLLVVTLGQWLNGGLYAVASILWFLVGWATRPDETDIAGDVRLAA